MGAVEAITSTIVKGAKSNDLLSAKEHVTSIVELPKLETDTLSKQKSTTQTNTTEAHDDPTGQQKSWPWQKSKTWMPSIAASTTLLGSSFIMHSLGYMGHVPLMCQTIGKFAIPCTQWAIKNRQLIQAQLTEFTPVLKQVKDFLAPAEKEATVAATSKIASNAKPLQAGITHSSEPGTNLSKPTKCDNTQTGMSEASPITINGNPTAVHVVIHNNYYSTANMPKPTTAPQYPAIMSTEHLATPRIQEIIEDKPDLNTEIKMPKAIENKPSSEPNASH